MPSPRVLAGAVIILASALGGLGLPRAPVVAGLLERLELATLDWRVRGAARVAPPDGAASPRAEASAIRLVLFDSASVRDWPYLVPFPRALLAELIDAVAGAGARVIGLDVYLDRRYPELDSLDDGDARLRRAIAEAGNVILVAPTERRDGERVLVPPDEYFAEVAAGVATADLPSPYETAREAYLAVRTRDGLRPSFPLALYARAKGIDVDSLLAAADAAGRLALSGLPQRYASLSRDDAFHPFPIRFVGPPSIPGEPEAGAFVAYSSASIRTLGEFVPGSWFRDRVVIMGSGFHDSERFRTPFYDARRADGDIFGWTYGPEVHASALENMLLGRYLSPLGAGRTALLLLAAGTLVVVAAFGRGVGWAGGSSAAAFVAVAVLAWLAFDRAHVHVPVVAPALTLGFAFLGSTSYLSITEGREKRRIREMFGKYVAPTVVAELIADPSRLELGGEKRAITVLFSDLVGFTSISEATEPAALVAHLNEYLSAMSRIVMDEAGTLDKYIGDAVMALYGAPGMLPEHALAACRTAVRMRRRLAGLNRGWRELGRPELRVRIGINTGEPVVGNIGGADRFDYTALGDAVNLAARLEAACKLYDVPTLISETTREAAGDAVRVRELDLLAVYGKARPVRIFELLGVDGAAAGHDAADARRVERDVEDPHGVDGELLELYDRGLAAYRGREFPLAKACFEFALGVDPDDGPSRVYLERSARFIAEPPPPDWDFVERRESK